MVEIIEMDKKYKIKKLKDELKWQVVHLDSDTCEHDTFEEAVYCVNWFITR